MAFTATFLVTTARSGTQWLAASLAEAYPDLLVAEHEPLGYAYRPRENLRDPGRLRLLRDDPVIAAHFERIHEILAGRSYIEAGFPAYALAPLLREEFGERFRLIHLTRHPVRVAASVMTHGWYQEGKRADLVDTVLPVPTDPGVALPEYAGRWAAMTAYERALFYWYQVHSFGVEQEGLTPPGSFARFRFEELSTSAASREAFREFLGLPRRAAWSDAGKEQVDRHHRKTDVVFDPRRIALHPQILALADRLGYAADGVDAEAIFERYRTTVLDRLASRSKNAVRSGRRWLKAAILG